MKATVESTVGNVSLSSNNTNGNGSTNKASVGEFTVGKKSCKAKLPFSIPAFSGDPVKENYILGEFLICHSPK